MNYNLINIGQAKGRCHAY